MSISSFASASRSADVNTPMPICGDRCVGEVTRRLDDDDLDLCSGSLQRLGDRTRLCERECAASGADP